MKKYVYLRIEPTGFAIIAPMLLFFSEGMLCMRCLRRGRYLARKLVDYVFELETVGIRYHTLWLALIIIVGVAARSFFLAQPMRYDEAYTFLHFVNRGILHLFFYPLPNNHVLHTLLVRISVGVFGVHPVTIRLPAFMAGVLNIPLTFVLAKSFNTRSTSGFVAATLVAVFPYLILYDTMARGYSLLVLINQCLVITGLYVINHPSSRASVMMAVLAALGLLDMPSFLFPIAGVELWIVLELLRRGYKVRALITKVIVPFVITMLVFTTTLYTPVIVVSKGVDSIVANRFVQGKPWRQFISVLPVHIFRTITSFSRGIPSLLLVALAFLFILGVYFAARERRWTAILLLPAFLLGAAVVLFTKHAIPYARTWIYFLPLLFIFIDNGVASIPWLSPLHIKMGGLVFSVCAAIVLMSHNTIALFPDTGRFPEAPVLVDVLAEEMTLQDHLIARCTASAPMAFYMWYKKGNYSACLVARPWQKRPNR